MEKTVYKGLKLDSVLTLIFVVLKLTDNIDWSWWWVFSPILISVGLGLIIAIILILILKI